jgi:hypothetical protein
MKTCSRALRTTDWGKGSPSNRTTTLSTQQDSKTAMFSKTLLRVGNKLIGWLVEPVKGAFTILR